LLSQFFPFFFDANPIEDYDIPSPVVPRSCHFVKYSLPKETPEEFSAFPRSPIGSFADRFPLTETFEVISYDDGCIFLEPFFSSARNCFLD